MHSPSIFKVKCSNLCVFVAMRNFVNMEILEKSNVDFLREKDGNKFY